MVHVIYVDKPLRWDMFPDRGLAEATLVWMGYVQTWAEGKLSMWRSQEHNGCVILVEKENRK